MTGYDALIQAIAKSPGLSAVLTLLLQSAFVMLTFLLISTVFNKLTRFSAPLLIHHFWLFAFIMLLVLPAQPMFDRNTLKIRLNQVLKETTMKRSQIAQQSRKSLWGNSVFALFILSVLTFNPLLSAQDTQQPVARPIDKEMLPITDIMPYYPRKAADQNIEGHAIAQFTVDAQGNVVEDSIAIIEATPSDIFNRSAIAAVRQFQFDPHLVNGQAVPVAEVEYQFNYRMKGE